MRRRCVAPSCALRNITVTTNRETCLGCSAELKTDVDDFLSSLFGDGHWPLR